MPCFGGLWTTACTRHCFHFLLKPTAAVFCQHEKFSIHSQISCFHTVVNTHTQTLSLFFLPPSLPPLSLRFSSSCIRAVLHYSRIPPREDLSFFLGGKKRAVLGVVAFPLPFYLVVHMPRLQSVVGSNPTESSYSFLLGKSCPGCS